MRENLLRSAWTSGRKTMNGWLSIPSPFTAEIMAHAGFDSLTIDLQHGLIDYQAAVTMLQAISTTSTVPVARVPWLEAGIIQKLLDAGAYGIICPMVNDGRQARDFVSYCHYPPRGQRSFGPIRATIYAGEDYPQYANDTLLAIAMIETKEAVANLDDILSTPGLSGIYVGPSDLSASLGEAPRLDPTAPIVVDAIGKVVDAAKRRNLFTGIHCGSTAYAREMHARGFDFVSLLSDARFLGMQAGAMVEAMGRDATAPKSSTY